MASAKEISQYLKRFSQLDAKRFAVVKVGGAVLRDDLDALTSSLSFLQEVGLTPIVLHGAGPQLDAELSAAGIEKQTVNGLRVTSPEALAIVRKVFQAVQPAPGRGCSRTARAPPRSPAACSRPITST
jgi:acetylglutamate kinase